MTNNDKVRQYFSFLFFLRKKFEFCIIQNYNTKMSAEQFAQDIAKINDKIEALTQAINELKINNPKVPLVLIVESNVELDIETKVTLYKGTNNIRCVKTVKRNTDIFVVVNDTPSQITYYENGTVSSKEWMDGKYPHKRANNGPYLISYFPTGEVAKESFEGDARLDVVYELLPCHHMASKAWFHDKARKNIINNPISYEEYNHDGLIVLRKRELSVKTGSVEPTLEVWDPSGKVKLEEKWEMYDDFHCPVFHREHNPAHILYDVTGERFLGKWYINGKRHKFC